MIDHLNNLLRHLLMAPQISEITTEEQVSFEPPDERWRNQVTDNIALNIYLVDLRENRKLRSNERVRVGMENGQVMRRQAPARMDCHYLASAWSPAEQNLEPTLDEHALLYQVTATLMHHTPLNPSRIYPADSLALNNTPEAMRDADLPVQILPVEGFPKLAEFWGTMGVNHRWKPAIYLIVTIPVVLQREIAGPMVTTLITEYRLWSKPETAETWIQIGGHVYAAGTGLPLAVGSATVTAVSATGTTVTVDDVSPFQEGDTVTQDETARTTISAISNDRLRLAEALPGLAVGATMRIANLAIVGRVLDGISLPVQGATRIANLAPAQTTVRLTGVSGLQPGQRALIRGEDADNPGSPIDERVIIEAIDSNTGFVTLGTTPLRTRTVNLDVPSANAPRLQSLDATAGAWVRLARDGGAYSQTTETDADGRFHFKDLHQGNYTLTVRAQGFQEQVRPLQVPSPMGGYDVVLVNEAHPVGA